MKALGVGLIVIGIIALFLPLISFTKKEKLFEVGPVKAVVEKKETLPLSPLLGVSALAVGGALLVAGAITSKK